EKARLVERIRDMRGMLRSDDPTQGGPRTRPSQSRASQFLVQLPRHAAGRHHADSIALAQIKCAELRLTYAHRVLQHGLEDRLQLTWRPRNDAQHLRGRRLLLQRLG